MEPTCPKKFTLITVTVSHVTFLPIFMPWCLLFFRHLRHHVTPVPSPLAFVAKANIVYCYKHDSNCGGTFIACCLSVLSLTAFSSVPVLRIHDQYPCSDDADGDRPHAHASQKPHTRYCGKKGGTRVILVSPRIYPGI